MIPSDFDVATRPSAPPARRSRAPAAAAAVPTPWQRRDSDAVRHGVPRGAGGRTTTADSWVVSVAKMMEMDEIFGKSGDD